MGGSADRLGLAVAYGDGRDEAVAGLDGLVDDSTAGFAILDTLALLGWDVSVVAHPRGGVEVSAVREGFPDVVMHGPRLPLIAAAFFRAVLSTRSTDLPIGEP